MGSMAVTRSSLELMLDTIQQKDEQPKDVLPALPHRPASRGRLPRARRSFLTSLDDCSQDFKETEKEKKRDHVLGIEKNEFHFRICVSGTKRMRAEQLIGSSYASMLKEEDRGQMPAGRDGTEFVSASTNEFECSDNVGFVLKKIGMSEEMSKIAIEGILGIQKRFRGNQARCYYIELKRGITTLQSFVRGENARKEYQFLISRLTAVIVIQKHVKKWIAWGMLKNRESTIICLQSVIRGWLTRRHLNYMANSDKPCIENTEAIRKPEWKFSEAKDHVRVPSSALVELESRVAKAEATLGKKEEENAILQQRLLQFENRWSEYEAKMKAMEEMWQKQLTSLQVSLGAAKKSLADKETSGQPGASSIYHYHNSEDTLSMGTQAPDGSIPFKFSIPTHDAGPVQGSNGGSKAVSHLLKEFEQQEKVFDDDASFLIKVKSGQSASRMSPDDELRKLKLRFEAWKKDYKIRLHETKVMLQKIGHSEMERNRKKWWGKMSVKGMWDF